MDPCRDIHREVFEKRLTLADLADTWLDLGLEQVRVLGSGVAALKGRPSQKNRKFLLHSHLTHFFLSAQSPFIHRQILADLAPIS